MVTCRVFIKDTEAPTTTLQVSLVIIFLTHPLFIIQAICVNQHACNSMTCAYYILLTLKNNHYENAKANNAIF